MESKEDVVKSKNSVLNFAIDNRSVKSAIDNFDHVVFQKSEDGGFNCVYDGLLKKITLCENIMSFYINDVHNEDVIDLEKEHMRYMDLVDTLSYNRRVLAISLPIFRYQGKTLSIPVGGRKFKNRYEFEKYFNELNETVFVYFFRIYNDDSIVVRYTDMNNLKEV